MSQLLEQRSIATELDKHPKRSRRTKGVALILLGLIITLATVWPVWAAVELNYFNVVSSSSVVLLEWSTAREYNLAAFQLMCKIDGEPESAYHPIATKPAVGNPQVGAMYDYLVTSGLNPGVSYCFRLKEITTNGEPGEVFDRCGYGLNMTPTPTLEPRLVAATATAAAISTTIALQTLQVLSPTNIISPAGGITDPLILTLTPPALPQQPIPPPGGPISPLPTPDPLQPPPIVDVNATIVAGTATSLAATATAQQQTIDANATTTALLIQQATQTAIALTMTPAATITPTVNSTPGVSGTTSSAVSVAGSVGDAPTGTNSDVAANVNSNADINAAGVPDPAMSAASIDPAAVAQAALPLTTPGFPYVIVTAQSTLAPVALNPTLTPLPTALPTVAPLLGGVFVASTQNMMVLLLFLVFFGASGIGILGLLSGVLYVRARERRPNRYDSR